MKAPVKYIVVGKFTRDGNGCPCFSLPKEDIAYVDMEKEYIMTIEGPCAAVSHKQIKNHGRTKTIIRSMPKETTVFT